MAGIPLPIERIPVQVFPDAHEVNVAVAREIRDIIGQRAQQGKACVLGLATGSTPTGVYGELVRMHQQEGLSFRNVISFNLDEYYPMQPMELQSYVRFMKELLFDHVDIPPENIHIPDGTLPRSELAGYCQDYERKIRAVGGIDIQLLGIGRTGHIGFNEPGSGRESRTRLIALDSITRMDAASDFFGEEHVPQRAVTMGVGTILEARRIILMAFGEHKAPIIAQAVEQPMTDAVAASFLQGHPHTSFVLDAAAAAELARLKTPWRFQHVTWTPTRIRKAVIWLARQLRKPILKLTNEDYNENTLQELLAEHGAAYKINIDVFRTMQETITGWPGGKPEAKKRPGDIRRKTDTIFPKRVLIFSPHPDDDVISMGGTLIRLVDQGHEVHVAYQTSGNIAVFDGDALRFVDFALDFNRMFGMSSDQIERVEDHLEEFLRNKKPGQVDSLEIQQIKALIRRGEARAASRAARVPLENLHFLDLPFYETGTVKKRPLGEEDVRIVTELLEHIQPHQVYAAGDLTDPHGTHRVCLSAILAAVDRVRTKSWFEHCEIWLYRGAWQEWEPEQIDMAVAISPEELLRKRSAIFKHQSQKDRAMFPGIDKREFWQRAEDRNRATAVLYDQLGLAEYEAIEGFVRWLPEARRES